MNERGLKSRAGSDWSPTTVHTILSSPFYSGTYRYNYRDESNAKRFREKGKDEWVLVENHHPAIVSPERQAAVGVILESKRYNKKCHLSAEKRPRLRRAAHLRLLRLHDGCNHR